eukprot:2026256-Prymnesium_polylepis.3
MGKANTYRAIQSIHDNLVAKHGIDSDKLTARAIRYMLEKKHNKEHDAYKKFRTRLYADYINQIHKSALDRMKEANARGA